MENTSLKL